MISAVGLWAAAASVARPAEAAGGELRSHKKRSLELANEPTDQTATVALETVARG